MIRLKDTAGYAAFINPVHVTHIAQAIDQNSKNVLLNTAVVFFANGQAIAVQGSPEQVAVQLEHEHVPSFDSITGSLRQ